MADLHVVSITLMENMDNGTAKTVLTFRGQVTRMQFWTAGGWLLLVWVVLFFIAVMAGLAGGVIPLLLAYCWFAYTAFALYAWTALVVGRLRHLRTSLWWVALWPLTGPVLWTIVGVLQAHPSQTRCRGQGNTTSSR